MYATVSGRGPRGKPSLDPAFLRALERHEHPVEFREHWIETPVRTPNGLKFFSRLYKSKSYTPLKIGPGVPFLLLGIPHPKTRGAGNLVFAFSRSGELSLKDRAALRCDLCERLLREELDWRPRVSFVDLEAFASAGLRAGIVRGNAFITTAAESRGGVRLAAIGAMLTGQFRPRLHRARRRLVASEVRRRAQKHGTTVREEWCRLEQASLVGALAAAHAAPAANAPDVLEDTFCSEIMESFAGSHWRNELGPVSGRRVEFRDDVDTEDPSARSETQRIDVQLTVEQAIARANLTRREAEVLRARLDEESYREIAERLGLSEGSVGRYLADARRKMSPFLS